MENNIYEPRDIAPLFLPQIIEALALSTTDTLREELLRTLISFSSVADISDMLDELEVRKKAFKLASSESLEVSRLAKKLISIIANAPQLQGVSTATRSFSFLTLTGNIRVVINTGSESSMGTGWKVISIFVLVSARCSS